MEVFPDAKVVLTIRDPGSWYKSVFETIYQLHQIVRKFPMNILVKLDGSSRILNTVDKLERQSGKYFKNGFNLRYCSVKLFVFYHLLFKHIYLPILFI